MHLKSVPGRWWSLGIALAVLGCRSYAPKPLESEEILARIAEERDTASAGEIVSLREAADLMRQFNPRIQNARAAYRTEQAVADVKTPMPNPTIDAVPMVSSASGLGSQKLGGDFGFGWAIPLAGQLRLTDDLNAIRAEAASIDIAATEREEYLALRGELLDLGMAGRIDSAFSVLYRTVEAAVEAVRAMVMGGHGTALDVMQFEQEFHQAELDMATSQEVTAVARANVGARAGVAPTAFERAEVPPLPRTIPDRNDLGLRMLRDHPGLARLRAKYAVAEKELRLEIARQYPDLNILGLVENDSGDTRYGIGIGIDLPIFDRNQPAIARADARREELRQRFEAQVRAGLGDIDTAYDQLRARLRQIQILRSKLKPSMERTLLVARRALEAGSVDGLQFLTVLKDNRRLRIRVLEVEQEVLDAWVQLEAACGSPLLVFPEEPDEPEDENKETEE